MTIPHCNKHTRFIPRCKECENLKQTPPIEILSKKEPTNIINPYGPAKAERARPIDESTKRQLFDGRKYERILVPYNRLQILEYYFTDADSWGYEHYTTIVPEGRDFIILVFKLR